MDTQEARASAWNRALVEDSEFCKVCLEGGYHCCRGGRGELGYLRVPREIVCRKEVVIILNLEQITAYHLPRVVRK